MGVPVHVYIGRAGRLAGSLFVVVLLFAGALVCSQAPSGRSRAPPDTLGGFKTDEVALESTAVSICSAGTDVKLAYYGTINTAPSVALMTYGASGSLREQVAAKYPFAVAVASEPGAGSKTFVSYIANSASGLEVNLAENKTGKWTSNVIAIAKPAGKLNSTGVAVEPGGVAHVIFLNATHMGHASNSILSYLPADSVAPSISVLPAGKAGIALSSGGTLRYATPWANSTGFDIETVSTTVQPDSGTRLVLLYDPAGNPVIFFTSSGSAFMGSFNASWTVSPVAQGTVLAASIGVDGMYNVLVERNSGSYSSVLYLSKDGAGGWQTIDLGQCRPGYPAGITVTPQGMVHIAINTALKGFLHGYRGAVPGPVQSLDATPGNKKVVVTWQPPADATAPAGFMIKRGTTPSALSAVNDSPAGTTAYIDSGLTNDQVYYYSIFPYNEYGESRTSPVINVSPKLSYARVPGAPYSLGASVNLSGGIDLAWRAPSDDGGDRITGYKIYRGTTIEGIAFLAQTAGPTLMYPDHALAPGTSYHYRVSALNEVGEGEGSNIADCTSKAVITTLVTNVTPQKFLLGDDGTAIFDIEVKVTGNGEPVAGVTVIVDVEGLPGYTRYGLTDSKGTIKFNGYNLNKDAEGRNLTVRSSLGTLSGGGDFPITKKTVAQKVTDWMPLMYLLVGGAVLLSCTAGAGVYLRRRASDKHSAWYDQKRKEIDDISKILEDRLSKPISSGSDMSPVDGNTLFSKWKEVLAAVARLGGATSTGIIDRSKLLSSSVEYCGHISAQEEREVVKEYMRAVTISTKLTITPKPQPVLPKEGAYANDRQVFYRSETVRKCSDCDGAGKVDCPKCHARRYVTCPVCGGSKLNNCAKCGGSGMARCPTCASGDLPKCPHCKGSGRVKGLPQMRTTHGGGGFISDGGRYTTDSAGNKGVTTTWTGHSGYSGFEYVDTYRECGECGGTGKAPCPNCGSAGKGTVPCESCNSSGKVTCGRCNGNGEVHCLTCDTQGKVPCGTCEATGKMKDIDTIEYIYTHHNLGEDLSPSFCKHGKDDLDRNPEAVTEVTESGLDGRRPGDGEETKLLDKLIGRAKDMHSEWQKNIEGHLLFRTGWKLRAMPVTCDEVFSDPRETSDAGEKKKTGKERGAAAGQEGKPFEHKIFAGGSSKRWLLKTELSTAVVAAEQWDELNRRTAKYGAFYDNVRNVVVAALVVEGVIWAFLLLRATGIVHL